MPANNDVRLTGIVERIATDYSKTRGPFTSLVMRIRMLEHDGDQFVIVICFDELAAPAGALETGTGVRVRGFLRNQVVSVGSTEATMTALHVAATHIFDRDHGRWLTTAPDEEAAATTRRPMRFPC